MPIAWLVLIALCVFDPEAGGLEEFGPEGDVGEEMDNVAVSEAANVTEAEGEAYRGKSAGGSYLNKSIPAPCRALTVVAASLMKSPDLNRTAMLFAPKPTPALSVVDRIRSVVPSEIAVIRARTMSPSNVVVQPRYASDMPRPSTVPAHV